MTYISFALRLTEEETLQIRSSWSVTSQQKATFGVHAAVVGVHAAVLVLPYLPSPSKKREAARTDPICQKTQSRSDLSWEGRASRDVQCGQKSLRPQPLSVFLPGQWRERSQVARRGLYTRSRTWWGCVGVGFEPPAPPPLLS